MEVAVLVGSSRKGSLNRKLADAIVRLAGDRIEPHFVRIDDLPFYSADLEPDRTPEVNRFTSEVAKAEALLFVTPEYNRSIPAVLKNAVDWGSKPALRNVWKRKVAAITGASPGAIGTALAQQHLRYILGTLGAIVVGGEAYISMKPDLIDETGLITADSTRVFLQGYVDSFIELATRLSPGARERV